MATGKTNVLMETEITFPDIPILENRITVNTVNYADESGDFVTRWWVHGRVHKHVAGVEEGIEAAYYTHTRVARLIDEWISVVLLDMEHQIAEYLDEEM